MEHSAKCLKCGGTELKPGHLCTSGYQPITRFWVKGSRHFWLMGTFIPLTSTICLTCGFVELVGDPEAARAAIEKSTAVR